MACERLGKGAFKSIGNSRDIESHFGIGTALGAEFGAAPRFMPQMVRGLHESFLVSCWDANPGGGLRDDSRRKIVGRSRQQDRAAATEVVEDLRRDGER